MGELNLVSVFRPVCSEIVCAVITSLQQYPGDSRSRWQPCSSEK